MHRFSVAARAHRVATAAATMLLIVAVGAFAYWLRHERDR